MSLLELHDISKFYGEGETAVRALYEIDLSVDEGHLVAVMGPVRLGEVDAAHDRRKPRGTDERRGAHRRGGAVPACPATTRPGSGGGPSATSSRTSTCSPASPPRRTSSLPLELDGVSATQGASGVGTRRARASSGSPTGPTHYPDQLSGGERQRVAIARAVVGERHLLLADEPSGALDSTNGEAVMAMIRDACARGVAAVVVTHDAHLASWADRVIFLRDGHIVDRVAPDALEPLIAPPAGHGPAGRETRKEFTMSTDRARARRQGPAAPMAARPPGGPSSAGPGASFGESGVSSS